MLNILEFKAPDHDETRNFGYRPEGKIIDTIIIHYTVGKFKESYMHLTAPRNVSAHYLIDRDGTIFNLVSDDKMAWHAGASSWLNKPSVNEFSIGIELVNSGSQHQTNGSKLVWGKVDLFPSEQMTALSQLIGHLKYSHQGITDRNIIGHSDITAYEARHVNPGIFFDWKALAVDGHGLYPKCDISSITPAALYSYGPNNDPKITTLQDNLKTYGYKIDLTGVFDDQTRNVVRAFNMHFHNDINYDGFEYESWDTISDARLDDLLQQMQHESHTMMQEL